MQSEIELPQSNSHESAMWRFSCWNLPDSQKFRLLPWGWGLCLHFQTVYVGNGDDGSSHVPRQTHEGAQCNQYTHPEQVQMVACTFLQQRNHGYEVKKSHVVRPTASECPAESYTDQYTIKET